MTDLIDWDQNVNKSRKSDMGQFGTIFGWNNFRIITYCIAIADMSKKKQNKKEWGWWKFAWPWLGLEQFACNFEGNEGAMDASLKSKLSLLMYSSTSRLFVLYWYHCTTNAIGPIQSMDLTVRIIISGDTRIWIINEPCNKIYHNVVTILD